MPNFSGGGTTSSAAPSGTAGGNLSGTYPNPTVAKINGVAVTGTPSVGDVPTATGATAATWQTPAPATQRLDQITNPNADKTFDLGGNLLNFTGDNPNVTIYGPSPNFRLLSPTDTGLGPANEMQFAHGTPGTPVLDWELGDNTDGNADYEFVLQELTNNTNKIKVYQTTAGSMLLQESGGNVGIHADKATTDAGAKLTVGGSLGLLGSSSGAATIVAPAAAGTPTLTLPTTTGTLALTSAIPLTPDTPPTSPNAMDDEFNGASLNSPNNIWTWTNQGSGTITQALSYATMTFPSNGAAHVQRFIGQTLPAAPYTFHAKLCAHLNAAFSAAGMVLFESGTSKWIQFGFANNNPYTLAVLNSAGSLVYQGSALGSTGVPTIPAAPLIYLEINRTNTTLTLSTSMDGITFDAVNQQTVTTNFTTAPDTIGLGCDPYQQIAVLNVDFFRRTL